MPTTVRLISPQASRGAPEQLAPARLVPDNDHRFALRTTKPVRLEAVSDHDPITPKLPSSQ